jgi:3-hydroxyisobutyrate dehydrogenase-like beta-hydroxyacid dehydrogenase
MTIRFDPVQAVAFIGLGVAASAMASRTILKYKPDKVWKFVKQGE